jgi:Tfp pilus assembly protein PilF/predicted hydrocarbon binding protein
MASAVIGRLLVASLHQAIAELLPSRLEFYESWLSSKGFRAKRVSLAGIRAVFSFLRQEGEVYDPVMRRAGEMAAGWHYQALSPVTRSALHARPRWLRYRAATRLARTLVLATWDQSRARVRWRKGVGTLTVSSSLFCDVRSPSPVSLCAFYAALTSAFLAALGLDADVRVEQCQGQGAGTCVVSVTRERTSRAGLVTGLLVAALVGGLAGGSAAQSPVPAARERVLVMPFDNLTREPRLSWLGEGSSILLADQLRTAGIDALTRDERARAFERLQVPALATLSRATVIRIGELVGAAGVVVGSMALDQGALALRARRIELNDGRLGPEVVIRGALTDLFGTYGRLAASLWPRAERLAGSGPDLGGVPLAAFEQYVKGLLAETPASQMAFLQAALQAAPGYDDARLALWQACTAAGDHRAAREAVLPVSSGSARALEAQFLAALADVHQREYTRAFQTLAGLEKRLPSAAVFNNMGVIRIRGVSRPADASHATWYFSQARTLDPLDADYLVNLGYAYWLDGDTASASYWLREAVRMAPADGAAHALLAQVLHAAGQVPEAARELVLAQRLSSAFASLELKPGTAPQPPRGLERLKEALEPQRGQLMDAALEMVGQRDQRALAAFYLDRGRRYFEQERDRDAESELTRALYLSPYEAEAHLLLGRICLRTGRLREAIDAFKISLWSEETAAAHLALAEAYLEARNAGAARTEAERALALEPKSVHAQKLLERLRQGPAGPAV